MSLLRAQIVSTAEGLASFGGANAPVTMLTMNYLPFSNESFGTVVTAPMVTGDAIPSNSGNFGVILSVNGTNQFVIWTNGPAFPTPIQIGNAVYFGNEANSIQLSNNTDYSTIELLLPTENDLPCLSVSGFLKVPALPNVAATYDPIVLASSVHAPPYSTEDWTLQINCGQTNFIQFEDANSATGTSKLNPAQFNANLWLYFVMTLNTSNGMETGYVYDQSTWTLLTSCSRTMVLTNAFADYWLFGNNEAGSAPGLCFYFSGLNWTNTPPPPPPPPYTLATNQLAAQFKFNGDLTDASLNGNYGTEFGGAYNFVTGQDGVSGHAIAVTNATVTSSGATNPVYAITVNCWINTGSTGMPVAHGEFTSWFTSLNSDGTASFDLYTSGGHSTVTSTGNYFGGWHMLTATWDGTADGEIRVYRDGVRDATGSALTGTIVGTTAPLTIGSGYIGYPSEYFTGWIDDARVYGRALNDAEISAIYAAGADGNINL